MRAGALTLGTLSLIAATAIGGAGYAVGQHNGTPVDCRQAVEYASAYNAARTAADKARLLNDYGHARAACMGQRPDDIEP